MRVHKQGTWVRGLLTAAWLGTLLVSLYFITARTRADSLASDFVTAPPLSRLETPFLNLVTLGYRGLFDDFAAIWMTQIFADDRLHTVHPEAILRVTKEVTRHHPKTESLYMAACFVLEKDFARPQDCLPITLDGVQALPGSWRLPLTQGFMFAYRMDKPGDAALYYDLAASRPGAPVYLHDLVGKLAGKAAVTPQELDATRQQLLRDLGLDALVKGDTAGGS